TRARFDDLASKALALALRLRAQLNGVLHGALTVERHLLLKCLEPWTRRHDSISAGCNGNDFTDLSRERRCDIERTMELDAHLRVRTREAHGHRRRWRRHNRFKVFLIGRIGNDVG